MARRSGRSQADTAPALQLPHGLLLFQPCDFNALGIGLGTRLSIFRLHQCLCGAAQFAAVPSSHSLWRRYQRLWPVHQARANPPTVKPSADWHNRTLRLQVQEPGRVQILEIVGPADQLGTDHMPGTVEMDREDSHFFDHQAFGLLQQSGALGDIDCDIGF